MEYSFLITKAEAYSFYSAFALYLTATVIILSRYLRIIRNKKLEKSTVKKKTRRLYILAIVSLIICAGVHTLLFNIFFEIIPEESFAELTKRSSYYISIIITMALFAIVISFGIYLKGTSTLPRQQGPVSGV